MCHFYYSAHKILTDFFEPLRLCATCTNFDPKILHPKFALDLFVPLIYNVVRREAKDMTASLQKRNLGIDLLRIFAMLMVVCLHVLGLGDVLEGAEGVPVKHELFWLLEVGSYCAVNCYALISGYVYSKHR